MKYSASLHTLSLVDLQAQRKNKLVCNAKHEFTFWSSCYDLPHYRTVGGKYCRTERSTNLTFVVVLQVDDDRCLRQTIYLFQLKTYWAEGLSCFMRVNSVMRDIRLPFCCVPSG
jgi:hypothetical protein